MEITIVDPSVKRRVNFYKKGFPNNWQKHCYKYHVATYVIWSSGSRVFYGMSPSIIEDEIDLIVCEANFEFTYKIITPTKFFYLIKGVPTTLGMVGRLFR